VAGFQPFEILWNGYEATLMAATGAVVTSALAAVGQLMLGIMTVYVVVCAVLLAIGQMRIGEIQSRLVTAVAVSALLSTSFYTTDIQQFFLTTLPTWIAQAVGGKSIGTGAQQFDLLFSAVTHEANYIQLQANGIEYLAEDFEVGVAKWLCYILLSLCFNVWACAQVLTAIVICVGPFVVPGYLFKATKGVADRWLSKIIGLMILLLLVNVLLQIIIYQDSSLYQQLAGNPGAGVAEEIEVFWEIVLVFGFGTFVFFLLPSIAIYIGGGVSFAPAAIFVAAANMIVPRRR
jgi:type IV secretion system protein VirB6